MSNIEQLEVSLQECNAKIALANMVATLHNNREFKTIIVDGFFRDYVVDLTRSLAEPQIANNEAKRQEVLRTIEGVATLHGYLQTVYQQGSYARMAVDEHQADLAEARKQAE